MAERQKHEVELDISIAVVVWVVLVAVTALVMNDNEKANQRASIQTCWNKGGVPVFTWYSVNKLADCRFPSATSR